MGRKGVSKRKPKQQKSSANGNPGGGPMRSGGNAVAALVKDKSAPLNSGSANPSAGFNKKHKKGK